MFKFNFSVIKKFMIKFPYYRFKNLTEGELYLKNLKFAPPPIPHAPSHPPFRGGGLHLRPIN